MQDLGECDFGCHPSIKSRLVAPLGRKLLYADHIKFAEMEKALSAPPTSGQTRELLPASPAKERVEKGLSDKSVRSYGDLLNFIDENHKGTVEDKPMFSPGRAQTETRSITFLKLPDHSPTVKHFTPQLHTCLSAVSISNWAS